MATTPTLARPGVKVFTEFRTATTTPIVPALPPCVIGVANEIVEAVMNDGSLNGDALVALPARIEFLYVNTVTGTYPGLGSEDLQISINNGPTQTITFPAAPADPTFAEVKAYIDGLAIAGLLVDIEVADALTRVVLRTAATGPNAFLSVVGGSAVVIGFLKLRKDGFREVGRGGYNNYFYANFSKPNYPDPRGNLSELTLNYASMRAFLAMGGGAFQEIGAESTFLRGAGSITGSVVNDGDGDNLSPYVRVVDQDFTAAAGLATTTSSVVNLLGAFPIVTGLVLTMSINGEPEQTLTLTGLLDRAALVDAINHLWAQPGETIATTTGNFIKLTAPIVGGGVGGEESVIRITATTGASTLGITAGRYVGAPYPVAIGDVFYGNGVAVGVVTEVAPAGNVTDLRLDTEVLTTKTWTSFHVQAMGLAGLADADRPSADLYVDVDSGEIVVKHEIFRDSTGTPTAATDLGIYLAYTGLRLDVSAAGSNASLMRIGSLTDLETKLSPITSENPLGLGMYFAMLNAPGMEVLGLGIGAISVDEPEGTLTAWAQAFEFVESKDVYAIAALAHAASVADLADAHVTTMADPEVGLERCVFLNPTRPTRVSNTIIGSGQTGNAAAGGTNIFQTGLANLPALLAAAGLTGGTYTITNELFLTMDNNANHYLITGVTGSQITVSEGAIAAVGTHNNDDAFYSVLADAFPDAIVDCPFTISIRGAVLASLTEEAIAYAAIPSAYLNRRLMFVTPDKALATVGGLEQEIEGYYLSAALAGKTAAKNPSDPLTEIGLRGFSGLKGATDRYGEIQYRIMDGGGLWSMMQEGAGAAVKTRHQLTSDMSSIEKREYSILNALDFTAKFIRAGLRNFIGRFNITANLQSSISTTLEGLGGYLTSQGVLKSFKVTSLIQDPAQPDRLLLDVVVGVLYPCNIIQVTLVV